MSSEVRAAIVVGGAGGIGSAISRRFAQDGYRVVVADRDLDAAKAVAAELPGSGHDAATIDVTDEASIEAMFDAVEAKTPAAVLVTAAGGPLADLSKHPNVATLDPADWRKTIDFNLTGAFLTLRKFAQLRLAKPLEHSRIIIIGSASGRIPQGVVDISYSTSKAAIFGLTRQAAFDLAPAGITVNVISPGVVGTPAFMQNTSPEVRALAVADVPFKRIATPEEIAGGAAYLASHDASYVTGASLDITGGFPMV